MVDALIPVTAKQEALSRTYVSALAAAAGFEIATTPTDYDCIDLEVKGGGGMRPSIAVQLKATVNLAAAKLGVIKYPLKVRNYNSLRTPSQTPRILVIFDMPSTENDWVEVTNDALLLRRRAYWVNLLNKPETSNTETVTIDIPEANLLNVATLKELLRQSATGAIS